MNRRSFIRKIVYLTLIGLLLIPLSYYSQPATIGPRNEPVGGGKLAQLRQQQGISEASLGEIDPSGETIKLATLGLRGVAVVMLWEKAKNAQMKEDWDGLQATLDQLTKLEPHFLTFWRHQAWNVSYNISVEWDDYHDRYRWVKEGIKLLIQGRRYNELEPMLTYDIGWTTAQKMGVADEKAQYRRLFREDDDPEFPNHRLRPQNRRDNWLVGQEYYIEAIRQVEDRGASIHRMNPLVFYSEPAMCQIDYSVAMEDDGIFEEKAKVAWTDAAELWRQYGARELVAPFGEKYRLNEQEELEERAAALVPKLEALAPGLRDKIFAERKAKLPADQRALVDTPEEKLSNDDRFKIFQILSPLAVTHTDLAERIEGPNHEAAVKLATDAASLERQAQLINHERDVVNYKYWRLRVAVEKTDNALQARQLLYQGKELFAKTDLESARETYEEAFRAWRMVLNEFPDMIDDHVDAASMEDALKGYFEVLKQLDEPFPKDFPIKDVIRAMFKRGNLPIPPEALEQSIMETPVKPESKPEEK